jgi:hypothetical protein
MLPSAKQVRNDKFEMASVGILSARHSASCHREQVPRALAFPAQSAGAGRSRGICLSVFGACCLRTSTEPFETQSWRHSRVHLTGNRYAERTCLRRIRLCAASFCLSDFDAPERTDSILLEPTLVSLKIYDRNYGWTITQDRLAGVIWPGFHVASKFAVVELRSLS